MRVLVKDRTLTNPASSAPKALVRRARQEVATTGHIADETCLRLIECLPALAADEQWLLIATLARPRPRPPLDPRRNYSRRGVTGMDTLTEKKPQRTNARHRFSPEGAHRRPWDHRFVAWATVRNTPLKAASASPRST